MLDLIVNFSSSIDFGGVISLLDANTITISDRGLIAMGAGMATTGCLGAGIGQGFSAGKASEAIGRNPEVSKEVRITFLIGAAFAETGAIYSLLVAIILLFVYK